MKSGKSKSRMDRRVQKTKKLLSQALIDSILEKGYEKVTVQDVLDKANVGRSTFYTHYENKELLLLDGPRNLGLTLFGERESTSAKPGSDNRRMGFPNLFQHVSENLPLAKAMLGKNGGRIIMDSFHHQISTAITDHYRSRYSSGKKEKLTLKYLAHAAAAAVCSLVTFWVDDELSLTVDEISMRCQQLVEAILR